MTDPTLSVRPVAPMPSEAVVSCPALTKRYGELAVDEVSFSLERGTVTGYLGPNGAGKTTTLRLLLSVAEPTSGEALVSGRLYRELEQPVHHIGAVLESNDFHPARSGRDHLRMLALAAGLPLGRVEEMLELVELGGAAKRRVRTYSLGMRQRLGLAAALLGRPGAPDSGRAGERARPDRGPLAAYVPPDAGGAGPHGARLQPLARRGRPDCRPGFDHRPRAPARTRPPRRAHKQWANPSGRLPRADRR
jgi:ABC transporter